MSSTKPIVVVGSINTDLVVTTQHLPQRGETLPGINFQTYQGGKGANQAVAAACLGAEVFMIGMVGSDAYGEESLRLLQAKGVNCEHIGVEQGSSGIALITVEDTGENTIVVVPGANAAVTPEYLASKRSVIRKAGLVLAQLEIPPASVLALAKLCHEEGVPFMLDPAPAQTLPVELFSLCTWFTPNETEARFFTGTEGRTKTAARLRELGAQNILLKLGEQGSYIDHAEKGIHEISPFPVKAVDSTAAGDTFNGAFACSLVSGAEIQDAGKFAAAAAALSVTRQGAQAAMPSLEEVQQLLRGARPDALA